MKRGRKKFKLPGTPFERVLAEAMGKPAWKRKEDSKSQQMQPWERGVRGIKEKTSGRVGPRPFHRHVP